MPEEVVLKGLGPAATSDGRAIVYVSTETGSNAGVWRADADGRNATQLASGAIVLDPASTGNWVTVTPDDRQVLFVTLDDAGLPATSTVPLDGGTPARLLDQLTKFTDGRPVQRLALRAVLAEGQCRIRGVPSTVGAEYHQKSPRFSEAGAL